MCKLSFLLTSSLFNTLKGFQCVGLQNLNLRPDRPRLRSRIDETVETTGLSGIRVVFLSFLPRH